MNPELSLPKPEDETTLPAMDTAENEYVSKHEYIKNCAGCGEEYADFLGEFAWEGKLYCSDTCAGQSLKQQLERALSELKTVLDRESATTARYDAKITALEAERDALKADNMHYLCDLSSFRAKVDALTIELNFFHRQLDAVVGQETAYRKVLESMRDDSSGRDHFRYCKTGVFYPGLTALQDDRCSICEKIDTLLDTPPLKAGQ